MYFVHHPPLPVCIAENFFINAPIDVRVKCSGNKKWYDKIAETFCLLLPYANGLCYCSDIEVRTAILRRVQEYESKFQERKKVC